MLGIQFDLENVEWTDRDALSAMVATTAAELHSAGLQLSIATVPNAPGYPGSGGFAKWIYTDWRGAYDLAAIAKVGRPGLPDDLRPEHAVDDAWTGGGVAVDRRTT